MEEDSRCAPGESCYWIGQVAVSININSEMAFSIGLYTAMIPTAEYKNHTIRLLEVNYDKNINFGKEKHCSIKLRIE